VHAQQTLSSERKGEPDFGAAAGARHDVGLCDFLHEANSKSFASFAGLGVKQASLVADLDDEELVLDPRIDPHARVSLGRVGVADGIRAGLRDGKGDIVGLAWITSSGLEGRDHRMP
jgi:hypothetical protein